MIGTLNALWISTAITASVEGDIFFSSALVNVPECEGLLARSGLCGERRGEARTGDFVVAVLKDFDCLSSFFCLAGDVVLVIELDA